MKQHPLLVVALLLALGGLAVWWRVSSRREARDGSELALVELESGAAEPVFIDELQRSPQDSRPAADALGEPERAEAEPASAEPEARSATRLVGRVLDAQGAPLSGATVYTAQRERGPDLPLDAEVWEQRDRRRRGAQTGADGRFAFDDLRPGSSRIAVRSAECAPYDDDHVLVLEGVENDVGDLQVTAGVRLFGRVLDAAGRPVEGVTLIRPFDGNDPSYRFRPGATGLVLGVSDGAGAFDVGPLAPGPWVLLAHHERYPDRAARGEASLPGEVVRGIELRLEPSASISGVVRIQPGPGAPKPDSLTVVAGYTGARERVPGEPDDRTRFVRCAADGSFEIAGLFEDEPYRVHVRWHRNADDTRGNEIGPSKDVLAGERDLEFELRAFGVLSYRALDGATGKPVEGLDGRLVARRADGRERGLISTTSSQGGGAMRETSAEMAQDGELVSLIVSHEAYRPLRSPPVALVAGTETELGELRLEPLGALRARVISAETGEPVAGARVTVELRSGDDGSRTLETLATLPRDARPIRVRSRETDAQGWTTLHAGRDAAGVACATHTDWPSSELVEVSFGAPGTSAVDLQLYPGASARVRVVDPAGLAVAGAQVRARWQTANIASTAEELRAVGRTQSTDSNGVTLFERLTPGRLQFRLDEERVGAPRTPGERERAAALVDLAPESVTEVELIATPRGTLRGRVLDGGRALAGATIELRPGTQRDIERRRDERGPDVVARTDAAGRYAIPRLGAGRWTARITHAARLVAHTHDFEFAGRDDELDFELPACGVSGSVRDAQGRAVAGARIVLGRLRPDERNREQKSWSPVSTNAAVRTDAAGFYELRGVPPGVELQLVVEHEHFQGARSDAFTLRADELRAGVDFALKRGAILSVELETSDGRFPRARVSVRRIADEKGRNVRNGPRAATLDGRGRARFTGLAGGRYRVVIERTFPGQDGQPTREVEVDAGDERSVRFQVP